MPPSSSEAESSAGWWRMNHQRTSNSRNSTALGSLGWIEEYGLTDGQC
jgi:hypothetical protein